MGSIPHLTAWCSHFVHRYFIWFLISSYALASVCPAVGRWSRGVSFGGIEPFREKMTITLPMVMLALLLANAGLWVRTDRLKHLRHGSLVLLIGLGANLAVPIAYIFGVTHALRFWPDPAEVQNILLGLALIAAMPIAGSSTAWSQIVNGNLALSLGLVLFSTLLSPLTTPVSLHSVGLMATGDSAEELHQLAASGTGTFLILCVVIPSVLGIVGRWVVGGARIESAKHPLKLFNSLTLLLLNYSNASLSLPQILAHPAADFLALSVGVVVGLCAAAFGSGWLIARLLRLDRAGQSALMFGLGMNNNGTGLVLASVALADYPQVMLPIILYNLVQHLAAGGVAYLFRNPAADLAATPTEPEVVPTDRRTDTPPSEESSRCSRGRDRVH
jgi:BASS family bile acid:Na+ symporter